MDFNRYLMSIRREFKKKENQNKAPLVSQEVVKIGDFEFSKFSEHKGDSGELLLATRKSNHKDQYLIKHAFTDCACNEFIYTKLTLAMGYPMPEAVLFQPTSEEELSRFETEYIIGERLLNVINAQPSYNEIRELANNWSDYFAFYALYGMMNEGDGVDLLLADDNLIYRIDTTDAFPVSCYQLDIAAVDQVISGTNLYHATKAKMLSSNFQNVLNWSACDWLLEQCLELDSRCKPYFMEPFARIQEVREDYIDNFLNTLCYFYPDFIGEYFKHYFSALKKQAAAYWQKKR